MAGGFLAWPSMWGNPHLACVDSQLTVDGLAALDVELRR